MPIRCELERTSECQDCLFEVTDIAEALKADVAKWQSSPDFGKNGNAMDANGSSGSYISGHARSESLDSVNSTNGPVNKLSSGFTSGIEGIGSSQEDKAAQERRSSLDKIPLLDEHSNSKAA